MPAQRDVSLDPSLGEVALQLEYQFASTGASACFLYGDGGKDPVRVDARPGPSGGDVFILSAAAGDLQGRIVFLESHVFAVSRAPSSVRATATVVQHGSSVARASLSDSATVLAETTYAVFKFAFQFA